MLIVGFSRGGTHLFWSFLSSHPDLTCRYSEHTNLISRHRISIEQRLVTELKIALRMRSNEVPVDNVVDKIVFPRQRPRKPSANLVNYIKHFNFDKGTIIFLVKPREMQLASWARGGAKNHIAEAFVDDGLRQWLGLARITRRSLFVNYTDFCNDPIAVTKAVWKATEQRDIDFPLFIEWAPKAYKRSNSIAISKELYSFEPTRFCDRQWGLTPTEEICASLRDDTLGFAATASADSHLPMIWKNLEFIEY